MRLTRIAEAQTVAPVSWIVYLFIFLVKHRPSDHQSRLAALPRGRSGTQLPPCVTHPCLGAKVSAVHVEAARPPALEADLPEQSDAVCVLSAAALVPRVWS